MLKRFSLKWVIFAVTLLGIACASLRLAVSLKQQEVSDEQRALASLEEYHEVDFGRRGSFIWNWLFSAAGEAGTPINRLVSINAENSSICDDQVEGLKSLTFLERLYLGANPLGDRAVCAIGSSRYADKLQELDLSATQIGTRGLSCIEKLPNLEFLDLSWCQIDDEGIMQLNNQSIATLLLEGTAVTDRSLEYIARELRVQTLGISSTRCTGEGVVSYAMSLRSRAGKYKIYVDPVMVNKDQLQEVAESCPNVTVVID